MSSASSSVEKLKTFVHSKTVNSVETVRAVLNSQFHDDEKWALNVKLLRASGMFVGAILVMRNFGDLMAI